MLASMTAPYEDPLEFLELLDEAFPGYREEPWDKYAELRDALPPGTPVQGKVAAVAPFGVWIDIGVGVPALLEISDFTAGFWESHRYPDDSPPFGSPIDAYVAVVAFSEYPRMRLTQQPDS